MAKIKKVKKTSKVSSNSQAKFRKTLHTHTNKKEKSLSAMEMLRVAKAYIKHFIGLGKVTMGNILEKTQKVDIERSNKQLSTLKPVYQEDGLFMFKVRASGLSKTNEWGILKNDKIATSHQVNVWFDLENYKGFKNTKIKFECSCGRHTYWYRYMATKGGWGLGIKEERYPSVRNPQMKGICCKHVVRVVRYCHGHTFQKQLSGIVGDVTP